MEKNNTINGRTPEEIRKGLENGRFNCEFVECCETDCPYEAHCRPGSNLMVEIPSVLVRDALERIQQLERERDAAVEDIFHMCANCKHEKLGYGVGPCPPIEEYLTNDCSNWQWRGVPQEVE